MVVVVWSRGSVHVSFCVATGKEVSIYLKSGIKINVIGGSAGCGGWVVPGSEVDRQSLDFIQRNIHVLELVKRFLLSLHDGFEGF